MRPSALECAKLGVYQAMTDQGMRKADWPGSWAGRPQVDRLFDLRHASRFDQIETATRAPGRAVEVRVTWRADSNRRCCVKGGIAYLRWLLSCYRGNISYTLAAYNAGVVSLDRFKGIPPSLEARDYLTRVLALHWRLRTRL